jgi:hypothetical protein
MSDSHAISCDTCQQRLEEFALDELTGDESAPIARHLASGCEPCNRRLIDIVAGLATLPAGLTRALPPLRLERELMRRIVSGQAPEAAAIASSSSSAQSKSRNESLTGGLVGAALALAVCLIGIAAWVNWRGGISDGALVPESEHWANLQRRLDEAESRQRFSSIPRLEFAYLRSPAPTPPVHGYIVADKIANQWHFYIFNLPPLADGRTYQLWFVLGDSRYVAAGTVDADPSGISSRLIDIPSDLTSITGIAISDEPIAGSDQPTGEHFFRTDLPK